MNIIKSDSVQNLSKYRDESLILFYDGDHSYDGVTRESNAYWKKLRIGSHAGLSIMIVVGMMLKMHKMIFLKKMILI